MLAAERRNLILEKLQDEKKVVVNELSELFGVSEETIRRDLDKLEKEGMASKTYGGAVLVENNNADMPFSVRKKKNMQGKRVIADIIQSLITDGDHIIVDPSTTAVSIVKALKGKKRLTIVTNSIEVLVVLTDAPGWDVISTGGTLRENYLALVGPKALEGIHSFNADKAIISCKGIDMDKGITDANEMFSQVKKAMLHSAKQKILAVDSTKFEKIAFSQICEIAELDMVVTDVKPSDAWLEYFKDKGIICLYGEEDEGYSICK
ncbi:MAG: DeoR/GlpR transcriptional regulator [Lachnospiraceae bacterium]|nr:DeoR/GlpR transcriptional regulator [Lachnospiraceae bacterium]